MADVINMPRLSDTMEEGTVSTWLKKVGDSVSEGDILAEIQTDKATMEFESFYSGTLLYIGVKEGETTPVDQLLAIIGKKGEDISALIARAPSVNQKTPPPEELEKQSAPTKAVPEDLHLISMPRLSDTMQEGTVASWLKKVGDTISEGDILAEIQTDKATMEFESFYSGTLLYIGLKEGQAAPVDSLLAIIGKKGTDVSEYTSGAAPTKTEKVVVEVQKTTAAAVKSAEPVPSNTERNSNGDSRLFVSPLARKIASEKGIDLARVKGSGEHGRIVKTDIENFKATAVSTPRTSPATQASSLVEFVETVPNSQMRKTIAKRLAESKFTAPHYYLSIDVNMDKTIQFRTDANAVSETKISFNDLVVKACALSLKKHPQVNSSWKGETTQINHHVNIGVAVAVEDGLVVPVLKFTDAMGLAQIGTQVKEFAAKAKAKKLTPADMDGSTFTISNLGMFGITEFTSIINQPNSAILSVGAIVEQPVVRNGAIVVGNLMRLTLACDHRTVDGATGAQFLGTLKNYIESPLSMLV